MGHGKLRWIPQIWILISGDQTKINKHKLHTAQRIMARMPSVCSPISTSVHVHAFCSAQIFRKLYMFIAVQYTAEAVLWVVCSSWSWQMFVYWARTPIRDFFLSPMFSCTVCVHMFSVHASVHCLIGQLFVFNFYRITFPGFLEVFVPWIILYKSNRNNLFVIMFTCSIAFQRYQTWHGNNYLNLINCQAGQKRDGVLVSLHRATSRVTSQHASLWLVH